MKRRGFIFTLDALLALILVTIMVAGVVRVTTTAPNVYITKIQENNKYIAQSLLETLRTVPLSNLVPPTQISKWIEDRTIDLTYVNPQMSPLDIVATYWALNSAEYKQKAERIMKYLLDNLARGYKYQLIINNYTSPYLTFDNSYENASNVGSATVMISGYVKNQTPRGYVAKAYLTKLVTAQEKLIGIQRVLAGGYYCFQLAPTGYNEYPLTVLSLYLEYQTVPGDENTVQSGRFQLSGNYSGGSVEVNDDLSGWSVEYSLNRRGYVEKISLTNGAETIIIYTSYTSGYNPELYEVRAIVYEDANGNQAVVYLNEGIYVEVSWIQIGRWWYISSSRAYTTVPNIDSAVYRVPVYGCYRWMDNSLDVTFKFELPLDASDITGLLNYATRAGESVNFELNGEPVTSADISTLLKGGENVFSAYFYNPQWYEIGFGSGSWISLRYKTSTPLVEDPGLVKLYNIISEGTGIYYLNSLFVPGTVTGISMKLTVEGVHEIRVYYSNGTALNLIYENTTLDGSKTTVTIDNSTLVGNLTNYVPLSELSRRNFNLIIMLDAYYNSSYSRPVRYAGQDYNYQWNNQRILYGYPDSYINITYIPKVTTTRFMIPIEQTYSLNGENPAYWWSGWRWYLAGYRTMYFNYYLPDKAIPWYVDVWTAIHFSGYPEGTTTLYEGPNANTRVFEFPLDYYLIRLAYTRLNENIMVPSETNTFKLESSSENYVFRVDDSKAIVHYFLNGYAPYGNVFPYYSKNGACGYVLTYYYNLSGIIDSDTVFIGNCKPTETPLAISASELEPTKYALDDAIFRLFVQLGAREDYNALPGTKENPIRVKLEGLAAKSIGIRNVPTTIEPIQITLRIWRD
ncbi:hypothetical protein [Pyrococcus yayanosii]|uniref:Uncharacterized protein n=1 Tax=Pyrococcus yayanosii (strain CH1 / JCM 16557) TaxID=529709 RepID=F8AER8_PYRYC|nr:hypothetical protein [Pyrococcus yayanosii]AEH24750.1 hypothetical protein PYCH_10690 [Pyrococcus yayanosii CH1]